MAYLGNTPAARFSAMQYQDLTGVTGSPVKRGFTLSHSVGNENEIEVFVNNVRQEPSVAYTVSGTALTMTGDVETTDDFYVVFQGLAQQTATHPSNSALQATTGTFSGATSSTDLTLSGGLYVGGTGSANYLDDYEEGTWTPTVEGTSGGSATLYAGPAGHYTKVGRLVTCFMSLQISSTSGLSGNVKIGGFPFTSGTTPFSGCPIYFLDLASNPAGDVFIQVNDSRTDFTVYEDNNTTNVHSALSVTRLQANTYVRGTVTYFAA